MSLKVYALGTAGLVLFGFWLGRRRRAAPQLGDGSGVSQVDYTFAMPRLRSKVSRQVTKARKGVSLEDYRHAEDLSTFFSAPVYNAQAYYHAAYWTAVASRLTGSKALARRAAALLSKANSLFRLPGSSFLRGSASEIMQAALADIEEAGKGKPQVEAVIAALHSSGSAGMVKGAQEREYDKAWLTGNADKASQDALARGHDALDYLKALVGKAIPGMPGWVPWLLRGGVVLTVLVGIGIVMKTRALLRSHGAVGAVAAAPAPAPSPSVKPVKQIAANPSGASSLVQQIVKAQAPQAPVATAA